MKWKKELQNSIRTLEQLQEIAAIDEQDYERIAAVLERSPMLVTPYYLSLIDFSDENDPIRKIALPSLAEDDLSGSYDTSGEADNTVVKGLQHKYAETALLLTTNLCATYCRHCFRKRLVGLHDEDCIQDLDAVKQYLMTHPEIRNALVSGGDALLNSNEHLADILEVLVEVPHLDFIRLATRVPVTFPQRINEDQELLDILAQYNKKKKIYVVTQFDHPREITPEAAASVKAFLDLGIPVRNQTVLLRGVNDDPEVLGALLRKLLSVGVEPYYIFQCRPVSGVKSLFQVPLRRGYEIVEQAKALQTGFGKSFRYCMSHVSGKIEIVASFDDGRMLFKYHEAKNRSQLGSLFFEDINDDQAWLD